MSARVMGRKEMALSRHLVSLMPAVALLVARSTIPMRCPAADEVRMIELPSRKFSDPSLGGRKQRPFPR
jgi:hypothetical protein